MDRVLLVVAIVFLYSSALLAANEDLASQGFQYTLVNYHENVIIEETSVDIWLDRRGSTPGTGIGVGVAPLFNNYGVYRTSSNQHKPTYVVLGFVADEFDMDQASSPHGRDDSGLSYGFGINNASFNFEYMMSVDQENYDVSAIGMSIISEF